MGRYATSDRYLVWCRGEDLMGLALWGTPEASDVDELAELWDGMLRSASTPFDKIFDVRCVQRVPDLVGGSRTGMAMVPLTW